MPRMTIEQQAAYALDFNVSRDDLKPDVQAEYDRLAKERAAGLPGQAQAAPQVPARSSPEVRARILEMFKRANPKYARPFEKDRLAAASIVGTESWSEYGQVVLQMAILDTLLSIEEALTSTAPPADEGEQ